MVQPSPCTVAPPLQINACLTLPTLFLNLLQAEAIKIALQEDNSCQDWQEKPVYGSIQIL